MTRVRRAPSQQPWPQLQKQRCQRQPASLRSRRRPHQPQVHPPPEPAGAQEPAERLHCPRTLRTSQPGSGINRLRSSLNKLSPWVNRSWSRPHIFVPFKPTIGISKPNYSEPVVSNKRRPPQRRRKATQSLNSGRLKSCTRRSSCRTRITLKNGPANCSDGSRLRTKL